MKKKNIIPYQELLGNYDSRKYIPQSQWIIPYQELLGNYDQEPRVWILDNDYTIPRAIREL